MSVQCSCRPNSAEDLPMMMAKTSSGVDCFPFSYEIVHFVESLVVDELLDYRQDCELLGLPAEVDALVTSLVFDPGFRLGLFRDLSVS